MFDLVEFNQLKLILAVAEAGNFTRAAERIFLTQPALSYQITAFEERIGFPVFLRTREGVQTTAAGSMVLAYAQEALKKRNDILTVARAVHEGQVPVLRLGFSSFVNPNIIDLFRKSYSGQFPGCPIYLSGGEFATLTKKLQQGFLDAALVPMPVDGTEWVVQQVAQSRLVACLRSEDPLARESSVTIQEIAPRLNIFRDPESHPEAHTKLIEMLYEAGINPEINSVAATPSDVQWMVRSGYGIALIDQDMVTDAGLIKKSISGVNWTADTAFVHHIGAEHCALPFLLPMLKEMWKNSNRQKSPSTNLELPVQLHLLTRSVQP